MICNKHRIKRIFHFLLYLSNVDSDVRKVFDYESISSLDHPDVNSDGIF